MTWAETFPIFLVAVAILLAPGLLIGVALGARRLTLLALAPGFTVSVIGITTLANHFLGFRWGVFPVLVATVIVAGLVLGLRMLWSSRWPTPGIGGSVRGMWLAVASGLTFAVIAIAARFIAMIGSPSHISQTFDNIYHLNAVRYILDTGQASPLTISGLTNQYTGQNVYYPDTWHALVALAAQITGATIPVATNVVNIAIAGVVWPLACMLLVRQISGRKPFALLFAGVLAAGFAAFPYLMADFGVLYPNLLSISLLPAAIATVVMVAGFSVTPSLSPPARWMALAGIIPGMALAHPSTFMALIAFGVPIAAFAIARQFRKLRERKATWPAFVWTALFVAIGMGAAALILLSLRPTREAAFWGPRESLGSALSSTVTNSVVGRPADFAIAALTVLGIWALARRRTQLWLLGSYAVAAGLYVVCASFPPNTFRYALTGIWYSDSFRLASLLPVVVLPLAAVGAAWLVETLASALTRWRGRNAVLPGTVAVERDRPGPARAILAISVAVAVGLATQSGAALTAATESGQHGYALNQKSALLSPDELRLLDRLDDTVPANAIVVGSPWTGTSLAYAIADRRALLPHIYSQNDQATATLLSSLRDAKAGDAACAAVKEKKALYVLDFGKQEVHGEDHPIPGLTNLQGSSAVELVDQEGGARLYHVTACG